MEVTECISKPKLQGGSRRRSLGRRSASPDFPRPSWWGQDLGWSGLAALGAHSLARETEAPSPSPTGHASIPSLNSGTSAQGLTGGRLKTE